MKRLKITMRSPKFEFASSEIQECINLNSLKRTWSKKIRAQMRNQVLIDLVEFQDYSVNIEKIIDILIDQIKSGTYMPKEPKHYLKEKSRGLCRLMTMCHPHDMLILQALSTALYSDLRNSMPTKKAYFQPGEQKFNRKQILLDSSTYGAFASWKRFQEAILEFSRERDYVVVSDVANFFDFINFQHLRNIISSLCAVREPVLDLLLFVLNKLSWGPDFMPRAQIGMPQMELEAPRVLANAVLFELDLVAEKHSYGDYVRFMDDIDVGVDSIASAKKVIRDIDLTLQTRQLRLNSSKTKILRTKDGDVAFHFCVDENAKLDEIALSLHNDSSKENKRIQASRLGEVYRQWGGAGASGVFDKNCRFLQGNGEKIFKRTTNLMRMVDELVPIDDLFWMIKNHPALREHCFNVSMHQYSLNLLLNNLKQILSSNIFVDNHSILNLSRMAVHAKYKLDDDLKCDIEHIIEMLCSQHQFYGFYASAMIASKFQDQTQILSILDSKLELWKGDYWGSRLAASVYPIMQQERHSFKDYMALMRNNENEDTRNVLQFHEDCQRDENTFGKLREYGLHENPSYPGKIYYPKTIVLLSLTRNNEQYKKSVLKSHAQIKKDTCLAARFKIAKAIL